jgi:cytochrome c5
MSVFHNVRAVPWLLVLSGCFMWWLGEEARADEPAVPLPELLPVVVPAGGPAAGQDKPAAAQPPAKPAADAPAAGKGFDPAAVSAGSAAFDRSCTTCHDAARSLDRTKDLDGWRATVKRMAAKKGAEVAAGDIEPIATFLASRTTPTATAGDKSVTPPAGADKTSMTTFVTLSPLWRGGPDRLQNPGFTPLAWAGASWEGKTVSGRVTVCAACHGVQEQAFLSRLDLVEAAARVDLSEFFGRCCSGMKGGIEAGRFIVPFGAFSSQTNPGVYRTVSTPLIFNMGQRVFNGDLGVSVLPLPYSNTGVNADVSVPVCDLGTGPITAGVEGYLINGLAGNGSGIDFLQSRDLVDNNTRMSGGGRVTVGDPYVRVGASILAGRFDNPNDNVPSAPLDYRLYGFDFQAHYKRLFRCQVEYARRDSDRVGVLPTGVGKVTDALDGYYMEAEVRPYDECRVSLLARQDFMRSRSPLPPPGSSLPTGTFNVNRFTAGINIELWHQSLLMINYERWLVPLPDRGVNVFGVRYTVTY